MFFSKLLFFVANSTSTINLFLCHMLIIYYRYTSIAINNTYKSSNPFKLCIKYAIHYSRYCGTKPIIEASGLVNNQSTRELFNNQSLIAIKGSKLLASRVPIKNDGLMPSFFICFRKEMG